MPSSPVEVDRLGGGAWLAVDAERSQGGFGLSIALDVAHRGPIHEGGEGQSGLGAPVLLGVGEAEVIIGLRLNSHVAVLGEGVLEEDARLPVPFARVELNARVD